MRIPKSSVKSDDSFPSPKQQKPFCLDNLENYLPSVATACWFSLISIFLGGRPGRPKKKSSQSTFSYGNNPLFNRTNSALPIRYLIKQAFAPYSNLAFPTRITITITKENQQNQSP